MTNNTQKRKHPLALLLALTLLVVVLSWVLSAYGVGVIVPDKGQEEIKVQSLIGADGLRWWLSTVVDNFLSYPGLGSTMVIVFGLGIAIQSGIHMAMLRLCKGIVRCIRHPRRMQTPSSSSVFIASVDSFSVRDRRGLLLAFGVLLAYILLLVFACLPSIGCLRSVSGGLAGGSLVLGLPFLVALGLALVGLTFGYATHRFHTTSHVVVGMLHFSRLLTSYMVSTFFFSILFSCLAYSQLDRCCVYWLAEGLSKLSFQGGDLSAAYAICLTVIGQLGPVLVLLPMLFTWPIFVRAQQYLPKQDP